MTLVIHTKLDTPDGRPYLPTLNTEPRPGRRTFNFLWDRPKMRREIDIQRLNLTGPWAGVVGVGMYAFYVFGRRVPALISPRREADT